MLDIQQNIPLKSLNTLNIEAYARYYADINKTSDIPEAIEFAKQKQLPILILGGGSNVVLTGDIHGLVIRMCLLGIEFTKTDNEQIRVTAAAGENWNDLVQTCLANQYYGLENLSLIPGSVGAAPIQNIGAYGVELKQRFESLTGWDCDNSCWKTLTENDCNFGYRDSIFKHSLKEQFVITSVSLILSNNPQIESSYAALRIELEKQGIDSNNLEPTPQQIAEAVIAVRRSKLPDPAEIPNAGSFFKNPEVSTQQFEELKKKYPAMVNYPQANGRIKLAAGWILEQAGWKGKKQGAVGMHAAQSLVLVNHGGATGEEVINLARQVQLDTKQQFGIDLEIEPTIY